MVSAEKLHENVPPDWYYQSIRDNPFQKYWHNRRFEEVSKIIEPAQMVLDIGCADGVFTNLIVKRTRAKRVYAIDVLPASIEWAKKHWKRNKRVVFKVGDGHKLEFSSNSFDAVFILEALEHVFKPKKVLLEVKRVLKKGGYAVFLVPTDNLLFRIIWAFVTRFWRMRIWDDCHVQSFNKDNTLADFCGGFGFEVVEDRKFLLGMLNLVKVRK